MFGFEKFNGSSIIEVCDDLPDDLIRRNDVHGSCRVIVTHDEQLMLLQNSTHPRSKDFILTSVCRNDRTVDEYVTVPICDRVLNVITGNPIDSLDDLNRLITSPLKNESRYNVTLDNGFPRDELCDELSIR